MGGAIVLLLIWLGLAAICTNGARKRGRSAGLWGVLGLVFGLFALITLYLLPPKKTEVSAQDVAALTPARKNDDLDRLSKLHDLRREGAISEEEFEYQKSLVLR